MNSVSLIGRLGRDPEIKHIEPSGKAKASFSIAVDRGGRKDADGNQISDWFDVEAWEKTAQIAADYAKKGSQVGIQGRLKVQKWKKDGQKHQRVVIVCERLDLLGSKRDGDSAQAGAPTQPDAAADFDTDAPF